MCKRKMKMQAMLSAKFMEIGVIVFGTIITLKVLDFGLLNECVKVFKNCEDLRFVTHREGPKKICVVIKK